MSGIKLRIVLVEDQGIIAMLLSDVLELLGHQIVAVASTEAAAIEAAERFKPELMIVDDGLGAGRGVAAVDAILRDRFVPHVFVSGDPAHVRELSPEAVIVEKPFTESELVDAINRALGVRAPRPRRADYQSMGLLRAPIDQGGHRHDRR